MHQNITMRKPYLRRLLKQKTILFHSAYRIKIGKPDIAVVQHPTVKTAEMPESEKLKKLLRHYLNFFYYGLGKSRRAMISNLAGRQIFLPKIKNLIFGVIGFYFRRDQRNRRAKTVFQNNDGKFATGAKRLANRLRIQFFIKNILHGEKSFFRCFYRMHSDTASSANRLNNRARQFFFFKKLR